MSNGCGQVSSLDKLLGSISRDETRYRDRVALPTHQLEAEDHHRQLPPDVECFEFKSTAASSSDWASEFATTRGVVAGTTDPTAFPSSFERAFAALGIPHAREKQHVEWVSEFVPAQASANTKSWIHEYTAQSTTLYDTAASWAEEFKESETKGEDNVVELRETAVEILSNLEYEQDPKLQNSRFVAYLKRLAGRGDPDVLNQRTADVHAPRQSFETWKDSFLQGLTATQGPDDSQWPSLEKTWETYQPTGLGYQDFAEREFSQYHFSIPIGANPYRNAPNKMELLRSSAADPRERILMLEALVQEEPHNQTAWRELGTAQQANEMDPQAIAAFLQATRLDASDARSWVGLAASCVNESCIPDALKALRGLVDAQTRSRLEAAGIDLNPYRTALEALCAEHPPKGENLLAASIICGMQGDQQGAIKHLEQASRIATTDWSVRNRWGASLANSQQYAEALRIYDGLKADGHAYPRILYNEGIALMCLNRHEEAARSFVRAIESQLPVDVLSNVKPELQPNYSAPLEALRINFSIAGNEAFANCDCSQLPLIKRHLGIM